MSSEDQIITQLKEQDIKFNLLQTKYNSDVNSFVSQTVNKWKRKFIANRKAPNLDSFLWHIFSFDSTKSLKGEAARTEYFKQWKTNVLIFNESQQYLIECINSIPKIEMGNFMDDIYIAHSNMKWTYVIPHEIPHIGPFFSIG